ncbi:MULTISPECIES: hypothetical protein [unclassified Mesorhizobium]|uniref:hypothetical protein n=1 Tax=unclassified Mesorhizobium TaxID=325217 RepID=UPI00112D7B73|nr:MULTISPECIES: hypothetical protein [unclassified Mesorhizobium]MBZ9701619.1 hypothetical protein [Mesorhizobium sp. CO1-1-3]MBZ9949229.1 hypothetical protein [Mesorhizobium sp. BR1-1-11]TPI99574.1 hypothetical protein FJ428_21820 [Mesorhizobium sp. B2-8-1]
MQGEVKHQHSAEEVVHQRFDAGGASTRHGARENLLGIRSVLEEGQMGDEERVASGVKLLPAIHMPGQLKIRRRV